MSTKGKAREPPPEDIGANRFGVPEGHWLSIMCEIAEYGYISGFRYRHTKTGIVVSGMENIDITLKGVEYLQENSMMKKVAEALKTIKDIAPGI